MKLSLIFLTFPIACTIVNSESNSRIIGGRPAQEWGSHIRHECIVSLQRHGKHFCAGVIFNIRLILTAATCVNDKNMKEISVFTSNPLLNGNGDRFGITNITFKQPYGPKRVKDNIAFLQTDGDMFEHSLRQWAPIIPDVVDREGINVTICGWGEFNINDPAYSNILMCKSTTTITVEECKKYNVGVDSSNICVRTKENSGRCHFDEGGPLISADNTIIGIATPDLSCGTGAPDVFTQLSAHYDWIYENVGSKLSINIAIIVMAKIILALFSERV